MLDVLLKPDSTLKSKVMGLGDGDLSLTEDVGRGEELTSWEAV